MHRLYEEVWLEAEHSEIAGCATEAGRIAEEEARTQRRGGGGGRWSAPVSGLSRVFVSWVVSI